MKFLCFLLLCPALPGGAQLIEKDVNPGSLWKPGSVNPMVDRTARAEGDLVTILISETSSGSFSASTTASKKDNSLVSQLLGIGWLDRIFKSASLSADSSNNGQGQTQQAGKVQARITAVVKKVLPNGNLVLEAARLVAMNKDIQIIRLSGVVRRDDVRSDNTVKSENIAEADIRLEGKGLIGDRQRKGLLTRILDWLF